VTTREIAEAAGIAEGTIFRVFPDKDAVISAVVASVLDPAPLVAELRQIDPTAALPDVLGAAVDAMRRRVESVWQIMFMLRMSGPPGREADTSNFVVVNAHGAPPKRHQPPDLTEVMNALADLLLPHREELRVPPAEAAKLLRMITFASAHPRLTDGDPLSTGDIVSLLLNGVGRHDRANLDTATASPAEKSTSERSDPTPESPSEAPPGARHTPPIPSDSFPSVPVGAR
jgi:AcrR family transcriptional regulator